MAFVKACNINEVSPMKMVYLNKQEILIVKSDNKIYAIEGLCSHKGAPLDEGELNDKILTCPWHQSKFDVTSGKVVGVYFDEEVDGNVRNQKKYEIKIQGEDVLVDV